MWNLSWRFTPRKRDDIIQLSKLNSYVSNIIPDLHFFSAIFYMRFYLFCSSNEWILIILPWFAYSHGPLFHVMKTQTFRKINVTLDSRTRVVKGSTLVITFYPDSFWNALAGKISHNHRGAVFIQKSSDELFSILLLYAHYQVNFTRQNWSIWGYDKNFYLLPRLLNFRVKLANFLLIDENYIQPMFAL